METAKVDIRKLQLLNDRINQCIDALNQVRLSVHGLAGSPGLSHTSPGQFGAPGPGAPYGFPGQTPFGNQQGIGLSHTGGLGSPFGIGGMGTGVNPGINPVFGAAPMVGAAPGQIPGGGNPFFPQPGLSHTGAPWSQGAGFTPGYSPYATGGLPNEGFQDPLLIARISQTFPYAQFPVSPVVSLY